MGADNEWIIAKRLDHYHVALALHAHWRRGEHTTLRYWNGTWWMFATSWRPLSDAKFETLVGETLTRVRVVTTHYDRNTEQTESRYAPIRIDVGFVAGVLHNLKNLVSDTAVVPPSVIPFAASLFDIETNTFHPHTPAVFTPNILTTPINLSAPPPKRWLAFLNENFNGEADQIRALQQWFGYCLTQDTSQEKILVILGPPRSGKGTIAKVQRALLGDLNAAGITLLHLTGRFGLALLQNKQLATVGDARIQGTNSTLVERLLSVSSGDAVPVERKGKDAETCVLGARLLILSNEAFGLKDASGALYSRLLILNMRVSHLNGEDPTLIGALLGELEGIMLWALEGLRDLRATGRLYEPQSSRDARREQQENTSPLTQFLSEECDIGAEHTESYDKLWSAWKRWSARNDIAPGVKNVWARELNAAAQIRTIRTRPVIKSGVKLKEKSQEKTQKITAPTN